jgi:hypothetical protein
VVKLIDSLSKAELLALADKLGIDAKAIVQEKMRTGEGLEAVWEADELERWN